MSTASARALFTRAFGTAPSIVASAPGRVNLIGEHTDYNGGEVLPIGIAHRTEIAARANGTNTVTVVSSSPQQRASFTLGDTNRTGEWIDYIVGVAQQLTLSGAALVGADLAIVSDVPSGAGLSSSAALEVAAALALSAVAGHKIDHETLPALAQRAECDFVGVQCGIMDQSASALAHEGHALHLNCRTLETTQVPFAHAVLIFDTAMPRALRTSAYNERREECDAALAMLHKAGVKAETLADVPLDALQRVKLPSPLDARARHVVTETARVRELVTGLERGELDGSLLLASHASLRDDYACSTDALDWFVEEAMKQRGVVGARLTGAGWGGCAIALGDEKALNDAGPVLSEGFEKQFGRKPRWWVTRAMDGARLDAF